MKRHIGFVEAGPARHLDLGNRVDFACSIAAAQTAVRGMVCVQCNRGIGPPRKFVGDESSPYCFDCVEANMSKRTLSTQRHFRGQL